MTDERAGAPAWLLIASGIVTLIYSLVYMAWTFVPIAIAIFGAVMNIMDGQDGVQILVQVIFGLAVPLVQVVGFAVILILGAITTFGGIRLNSYRSKGLVWLAILTSTAAPLLALVVNAGSALTACGMGCIFGCIGGNILTLPVLLLGAVASGVAAFHISQPEAAVHFEG